MLVASTSLTPVLCLANFVSPTGPVEVLLELAFCSAEAQMATIESTVELIGDVSTVRCWDDDLVEGLTTMLPLTT